MTSIEEISISGVRSFDPNPQARQRIVFRKPLTVILGKNGAGKTTVIESLLYACTGEMPPGSAGAEKSSFIYDPKVVGESIVKAQIRLRITATGNVPVTVIRSFESKQTRAKTAFSTLDSTICYTDENGERKDHSHRASDCDAIVPVLLGVSPAVLRHVIFCHQEESNWPLQAPSEVKAKFDDIFAATRYVAALDKLREVAKDYRKQRDMHEAEQITLKERKEEARRITEIIAKSEEKSRIMVAQSREIEPKMKLLAGALAALDSISHNTEQTARDVAVLHGRVEEKRRLLEELQQQLKNPPKHTLVELMDIRKNFEQHMKQLGDNQIDNESKMKIAMGKRAEIEGRLPDLRTNREMLDREEREHKRRVAELQTVLSKYASEFVAGEGAIDSRSLARVEELLRGALKQATETLRREEAAADTQRAALTTERNEILRRMDAGAKEAALRTETLATTEKNIVTKRSELQVAERALSAVVAKVALPPHLASAAMSAAVGDAVVQHLRDRTSELERAVAAEKEARKAGASHAEEEKVTVALEMIEKEVAEYRAAISARAAEHQDTSRLQLLRREAAEGAERLREQLQELVPSVRQEQEGAGVAAVARDANLDALARAMDVLRLHLDQQVSSLRSQVLQADRHATIARNKLQQKREQLATSERELQQKSAIFTSVSHNHGNVTVQQFHDYLHTTETRCMQSSNQASSLEAMSKCYESFMHTARSDHTCAVCARDLTDADLVTFIHTNEERQRTTPEQIGAAKKASSQLAAALAELRQVEPVVRDIDRIRLEIPILQNEIRLAEEEVQERASVLATLEARLEGLQARTANVQGLSSRTAALVVAQADIDRMLRDVLQLEKRLEGAAMAHGTALTIEAMQGLCDDKAREAAELSTRLKLIRREQPQHNTTLQDEWFALRTTTSAFELALHRYNDIRVDVQQQHTAQQELRSRLSVIATAHTELQKTLDAKRSALEAHEASSARRIENVKAEHARSLEDMRVFEVSADEVKRYITENRARNLLAAREEVAASEAALQREIESIGKLHDAQGQIRRVLDEKQPMQRTIDVSIRCLQLRDDIEEAQSQRDAVEKTLRELKESKLKDVRGILGAEYNPSLPLQALRDQIHRAHVELAKAKAQHGGAIETIERSIAEQRTFLAEERFNSIEKRYLTSYIKLLTTDTVIKDIERYHLALEKAVHSYHQEKIAHVNQIIADLWRQTYRGSDIDVIEVRSEDEVTASGAASTRKSYRYRVVMKRGNSELDMRGRCSAGQKVLASVIIRLALSEAFSCDCSVLALDEPTTNLDEDNAQSLAMALRDLSTLRRVNNFQLIVITHDEAFVRALGAQSLDSFYFVHKDRAGAFSLIEEKTYAQYF